MAPPVKKKKFSSDNRRLICENKPQPLGSFVTSIGKRRSVRVAKKMNRILRKIWICNYVWLDILPSFDHEQLGLKMALISDRFDVLVDAHFDGKTELTIWREIIICKDKGLKAKLSVEIDDKIVDFPMPDHSLPIKIRFKRFRIDILGVPNGHHLENLRRISPTLLTDCEQLNLIDCRLFPDGIAGDGPNASAGQVLSKWLHTPSKNGQPKRLHRNGYVGPPNLEWVNNFKETFRRATTSVSYQIQLYFRMEPTPIEPFELVNERTKEKLTLIVTLKQNQI